MNLRPPRNGVSPLPAFPNPQFGNEAKKLPWEDAVVAAIEELRAEKAAEAARKAAEQEPPPGN